MGLPLSCSSPPPPKLPGDPCHEGACPDGMRCENPKESYRRAGRRFGPPIKGRPECVLAEGRCVTASDCSNKSMDCRHAGSAAVGFCVELPMPTSSSAVPPTTSPEERCFLLHEMGVGDVRRSPSEACSIRVTPASTFKIPHALAALDTGVLSGPEDLLKYDGHPVPFPAWQRDHTLATAMRYSVVWYFQKVAERLGVEREKEYLSKLDYGNADPSSGLTSFWLGGSLLVSPDEQERFLVRLFEGSLPVSKNAQEAVRTILVQPSGFVVNATGEHPFAAPWPEGTTLSAKTGSSSNRDGREVRWLVGEVERGNRSWVFVSTVIGGAGVAASAAIDLAADSLKQEHVLAQ